MKNVTKHGNFQMFLLNFQGSFHSFSLSYDTGAPGFLFLIFSPQIKIIGFRESL
jgi:hypothetical protein